MAFLGALGRVLSGDTRGRSCRPGLRAGVVPPSHSPPPLRGYGQSSQYRYATSPQLAGSWRARPPPPGLAARKPRPHALSPRAGRARLVRLQLLLPAAPAACAARDCLLLVSKSTRHIPASRGMQGREKSRDEVVNSGYSRCAGEGRLSGWLGLGRGETRMRGASLARPPAFFPASEISKAAAARGVFILRSLRLYGCVRAGVFSERISVSHSGTESRMENLRQAGPGVSRARGGRRVCPARQARGLCGTPLGTVGRRRVPSLRLPGAVLLPGTSLVERSLHPRGLSKDRLIHGGAYLRTRAHERALLRPGSPRQGFCPGRVSKGQAGKRASQASLGSF